MYFALYLFMNAEFLSNWISQVKKGTLAFITLNILKDNEYYGYELIEKIRKHSAMEIAEGTLYPLLNRLKDEGLISSRWVEQESGIPRKYYVLTKTGITTLKEMCVFWGALEKSLKKMEK